MMEAPSDQPLPSTPETRKLSGLSPGGSMEVRQAEKQGKRGSVGRLNAEAALKRERYGSANDIKR